MKAAKVHRPRAPGRFACRLVLMAKTPVAGRVKTRLARQIGAVAATAFYRRATQMTLARLAADPRWITLVAVAPDTAVAAPHWPADVARLPQGGGDLGARMQRVFDRLPPGPVVIVGTDIPGIRPSHVAEAFALLGRSDAVFGPAGDGGYWLVGLKRRPRVPRAFRGVRWSHPETLADNRAALEPLAIATAATLDDVDHAAEWRASRGLAARRIVASAAPRSR